MKAIIFDLFETLITEWGKPKYLTSEVAADLGVEIDAHGLSLLGVRACDAYFVGDGGSDELRGAQEAGLSPLRALWFIKHFAKRLDAAGIYPAFYDPPAILEYITKNK